MWWFTWRQARSQTWVILALLVLAGAALAYTGVHLAQLWTDSGASSCTGGCSDAISRFRDLVHTDDYDQLYSASTLVQYVAPILIGSFVGVPMVSRELEAGTYRLAWNQSVPRTRWLATKLAFGLAVSVGAMVLLTVAFSLWARHLDSDDRIRPVLFGARGIVPIGHMVFAYALGVAAGILIRRTVPAMAATLAAYTATLIVVPLWIRPHLMPVRHASVPLDLNRLESLNIRIGGPVELVGEPNIPGWVLSNTTVTPSGAAFTGPADPTSCSSSVGPDSCMNWLHTLKLRQALTYQPMSHFWPLQLAEAGIYLALAAVLIAVCFARIRRLV